HTPTLISTIPPFASSSSLHRLIFPDPAPTAPHTLSLHDALPICTRDHLDGVGPAGAGAARLPDVDLVAAAVAHVLDSPGVTDHRDRKSTRLNSSHVSISYAVFCLKKKKTTNNNNPKISKHPTCMR